MVCMDVVSVVVLDFRSKSFENLCVTTFVEQISLLPIYVTYG